MMTVIRVDSSATVGSGHLMRCLTLAGVLKTECNAGIYFVCRKMPGNICHLVETAGYGLLFLEEGTGGKQLQGYEKWLGVPVEQDAIDTLKVLRSVEKIDLLIVDSYALDYKWENAMRSRVKKILAIDDLADRKHDCDFLLDQTYGRDGEACYRHLVPDFCKLYVGAQYVLLRSQFYDLSRDCTVRTAVRRVLIFYGGSDDTGETLKVLSAIRNGCCAMYSFTVIVGESNPKRALIENLCSKLPQVEYHCQVDNMEDYIAGADIAFAASGGNTWERCVLGLPSIVTITAENQKEIARQLGLVGAVKVAGWHDDVTEERYSTLIAEIAKYDISAMSKRAFSMLQDNRVHDMIREIGAGL